MNRIPFLSLAHSLVVLRIGTAALFMAHAIVRIVNDTIPQFAGFMGGLGFPQPLLWVWAIKLFEIIGGSLMILGYQVRCMALGLFAIAAGGIVLIHAKIGWFVGEHGTGGSEYSVCLILCLLVIAAADAERPSRRD